MRVIPWILSSLLFVSCAKDKPEARLGSTASAAQKTGAGSPDASLTGTRPAFDIAGIWILKSDLERMRADGKISDATCSWVKQKDHAKNSPLQFNAKGAGFYFTNGDAAVPTEQLFQLQGSTLVPFEKGKPVADRKFDLSASRSGDTLHVEGISQSTREKQSMDLLLASGESEAKKYLELQDACVKGEPSPGPGTDPKPETKPELKPSPQPPPGTGGEDPAPPPAPPAPETAVGRFKIEGEDMETVELSFGAESGVKIDCGMAREGKQIFGRAVPAGQSDGFDGFAFTLPREEALKGEAISLSIAQPKPDKFLDLKLAASPQWSFHGSCQLQLVKVGAALDARLSCPEIQRQDNQTGAKKKAKASGNIPCPAASFQ